MKSQQEVLQAILTECISRVKMYPGISPDKFEEELHKDPIYMLASEGLKNLVGGKEQ